MVAKNNEKNTRPSVKVLRSMSNEDLQKALQQERESLMQSRFMHATAQLEKTSELKAKRRHIARMETILTENTQRA